MYGQDKINIYYILLSAEASRPRLHALHACPARALRPAAHSSLAFCRVRCPRSLSRRTRPRAATRAAAACIYIYDRPCACLALAPARLHLPATPCRRVCVAVAHSSLSVRICAVAWSQVQSAERAARLVLYIWLPPTAPSHATSSVPRAQVTHPLSSARPPSDSHTRWSAPPPTSG